VSVSPLSISSLSSNRMRRAAVGIAIVSGAIVAAFVACADDTTVNPVARDAGVDGAVDAQGAPSDAGADADAFDRDVLKGARVLALDIAAAEDQDYLAALARARDAGVQATNVTVRWPELESVATSDAGADAGDAGIAYFDAILHIANLVLSDAKTMASL